MLEIKNITVKVNDKEILKDFSLTIPDESTLVLMGPNGVGKSTICKVLMNHPEYKVTKGQILFNNEDITNMDTTRRARLGMFYLNQSPVEVEGVTNAELLRTITGEITNKKVDIFKLNSELKEICKKLDLPTSFIHRDVNFNMSGGEKKKNELMHLLFLKPKFIILDEIDSGLDVDALKTVGEVLNNYFLEYKPSILIVTHGEALLDYFSDYNVAILNHGKIVKTGNKKLIKDILRKGFGSSELGSEFKHE